MSERDEWLAWRRAGVGASDVPALVGRSKWSTPYSVWLDKVHGIGAEETEPMRWGHLLEAVIAREAEQRLGLYVLGEQTWCTHREHAHHRATIDGFLGESPSSGIDDAVALLEIKVTEQREWDELPDAYYLQCQWQMHVTGVQRAIVAALHAGTRLAFYEVELDRDDLAVLVKAADAFWRDYVLPPVAPDVTADDLPAVRAFHAAAMPGLQLVADDTLAGLVEQLRAATASRKAAERYEDELKARLIARIADAELVVDAAGTTLARYPRTKALDVARLSRLHGEEVAACTRAEVDTTALRKLLGRKTAALYEIPGDSRRLTIPDRKD